MATSNGTPAAAPAAKPALVYESLLSSFAAKRSGDGAEAHKKVADAYTQLWAADGVEEGKDVQVRKQNSKDMVNYVSGTRLRQFWPAQLLLTFLVLVLSV